MDTLMNTYARFPVVFERGEGAWLWDKDGKKYLDAVSGIAVCGLGHAHPAVTEAICAQARKLVHTSNLYIIEHQRTLADLLVELSGMDRAFFCNSGAEANEAAIKLARLHGHSKGVEAPAIVVAEGSFHGRTLATLTATGNRKVQAGFEPLAPGFVRVPYNDLEALEVVAGNTPNVVAVLLEPVQGEGGVVIPDEGYLAGVRALCNEHGWLMMLDEVQTGVGRTGAWFAYQHENIVPDVMSLAKGLGNGVPIGACLARGLAADLMHPGSHGSTFGGGPLVCRAALAVLETMRDGNIPQHAARLGAYLSDRLAENLAGVAGVKEIRNKGLLVGIELDRACGELAKTALDKGVLINVAAQQVIRLIPPLIIDEKQADRIAAVVAGVVRELK